MSHVLPSKRIFCCSAKRLAIGEARTRSPNFCSLAVWTPAGLGAGGGALATSAGGGGADADGAAAAAGFGALDAP